MDALKVGPNLDSYQINPKTLAIIPINKRQTKVFEDDMVLVVNKKTSKIIEENCEYFGSSFEGRKKGTMDLLGITHKAPILIEESNNIIFFPTSSPRLNDCGWISLNNLESNKAYDDESIIQFNNNIKLQVSVSNKTIENQVLRATRLESLLSKRRKNFQEKNDKKY